jgi:hypothetical protein
MTNTLPPPPSFAEFGLHDVVSLVAQSEDLAAGSVGRVLGVFPHPGGPTYAVIFTHDSLALRQLRPHEIALTDNFPAAA